MKAQGNSAAASPHIRHRQWIDLGWKHQSEGRFSEAVNHYRAVLRENPRHPDALHLLGLLAKERGNLVRAEKLFRGAVRTGEGTVAIYCNNLANLLRPRDGEEARTLYLKALEADPDYVDAWLNMASYEELRGKIADAEKTLESAIERCPDNPRIIEAHSALFLRSRRFAQAIPLLQQLTQRTPTKADPWLKLGTAYAQLDDRTSAVKTLLHVLKLEPENAHARIVLSQMLIGSAAPQEAEAMLLEAAQKDEHAFAVLGNVYKELGYIDLALDCYARVLASHSSAPDQANFLYTLLYDPTQNDAEVAEEHRIWGRTYADPHRPAITSLDCDRDPDRPLRIGYVSGHFWDHAVALFSLPMMQAHNRDRFHLYLYSSGTQQDWATQAFQGLATQWRNIGEISDDAAAQIIREDRIDILVDLAGHIGGNRLLLFARKPAPIQVTYLGYQATTGMEVMDYRLTDAIADPPALTDGLYIESLVRLEPSFFVYQPSSYAPPVAPAPVTLNSYITFGCLNNPGKTGQTVVELWARLLHAIPNSRLLLLGPSTQDADPRVTKLFEAQGIESSRIAFLGKRPRLEYLRTYDRIDIALDPFPFSGHTTTCDALWQGVPVITLAGKTYAGRMSTSTLTQARLPHLIADSPEQYAEIATRLANDPSSLNELRGRMRDHLSQSPILDALGFVRGLESAYRKMWRLACEQQPK